MKDYISSIQDDLEKEFCPPLDTSLIAAFLADRSDDETLTFKELNRIKELLTVLAAEAVVEEDKDAHFSANNNHVDSPNNNVEVTSVSAFTEESDSVFDGAQASTSGSSISSGSSSSSQNTQIASAINFLRASFPHLSYDYLKTQVSSKSNIRPNGELDMERIVEGVLAEDYIREMKERDIELDIGIDEEEWSNVVARKPNVKNLIDPETDRQARASSINQRNSSHTTRPSVSPNKKKAKFKGKTLALSDVRQQHHKQRTRPASSHVAGDPWNQILSVSTYLSDLLFPPGVHDTSSKSDAIALFQSNFHNPEYDTPASALRSALYTISTQSQHSRSKQAELDPIELDDANPELFINLLEIVQTGPDFEYDTLSDNQRYQLCKDVHLGLATISALHSHSRETVSPETVLEIVRLLFEMDRDGMQGKEMGLYHTNSPGSPLLSPSSRNSSVLASSSTSPVIPPSTVPRTRPPPSPSEKKQTQMYLGPLSTGGTENVWQEVRAARPKAPAINPLAAHIPAYDPLNVPRKVKAKIKRQEALSSPTSPKYTSLSPLPTNQSSSSIIPAVNSFRTMSVTNRSAAVLGRDYKARIDACRERQADALRTASRHWRGGNGLSGRGGARGRGGEVAMYYAMEAQKHATQARALQMDAVRELVEEKRYSTPDHNTDVIDVHHCTSAEAITIIREVLGEGWVSVKRPLRIVTGRGLHSAGGVPILGPVVVKTLRNEGWDVSTWNAGVEVKGRAR